MASIRREFAVAVSAADAWDVVRDFWAVHVRLAPGFVTESRAEGDVRVVTFANGAVARERLVDCDESRKRLVYSATGGRAEHHNASVEIVEDGPARAKFVWVTDVLPNDIGGYITAMMDQAVPIMKAAIERGS
jgi:carbon monoxide dehydrogenase subunit G